MGASGLRLAGNLPLGIVVPLVCKMIGMESFLLDYSLSSSFVNVE